MKSTLTITTIFLLFSLQSRAQCWQITAGGSYHTIAIVSDGSLWGWGDNGSGQLGNGTFTGSPTPFLIDSSDNWQHVEAGTFFSTGLKSDGTLWSWGDNGSGTLGQGNWNNYNLTVHQIGADTSWRQLSSGSAQSAAIKSDSTLWVWGSNYYGQLGDGTTNNKNAPIQVAAAHDWKSVEAGGYHIAAIKCDGTLWAWGYNEYGQLGDGTNVDKKTPVQIGSATNWKQVFTGFAFTAALKNDGTLWTWGSSYSGQLGDGTYNDRNTPGQVGNANNWQQVSTGGGFVLAIKSNGTLWSWGDNGDGQLGIGSSSYDKTSPQQVGTAADWEKVIGASNHAMAIKTDGNLWTWGDGTEGELGDGTTVSRNTPAEINCTIVGTRNFLSRKGSLQLSPNAAHDFIRVEVTDMSTAGLRFEVSNMFGEVVISEREVIDNESIDVSGLAAGTYILTVGNRESWVAKQFVKI